MSPIPIDETSSEPEDLVRDFKDDSQLDGNMVLVKDSQSCERFAWIPCLLDGYREEYEERLRSLGYSIVHTVSALRVCDGERLVLINDSMPWIRKRVELEIDFPVNYFSFQ